MPIQEELNELPSKKLLQEETLLYEIEPHDGEKMKCLNGF